MSGSRNSLQLTTLQSSSMIFRQGNSSVSHKEDLIHQTTSDFRKIGLRPLCLHEYVNSLYFSFELVIQTDHEKLQLQLYQANDFR